MFAKLLVIIKNPLFIIPPLVVMLMIGWRQYTYAGRNLSLPNGVNLLPGSFSQLDSSGVPTGWQLSDSGQLQYTTSQTNGYAGGKAFEMRINAYKNGDLALSSPRVTVHENDTYLFKGYYTASTAFSLLKRTYYADGSSSINLVQNYAANESNWSTASDAFKADSETVAVQYIFRAYGNGSLDLNSFYLEPNTNVYIPAINTGTNIIQNAIFGMGANDTPTGWSTYHSGTNTAAFSYLQDPSGSYLVTQVSGFSNGEAKWQYIPQAVKAHAYYQMSVTYQSNVAVPIVAEYMLNDGKRLYQTIDTAEPADRWTTVTYPFEIPTNALNMFISLPLHQNGMLETRNYQLINISKLEAKNWPGPLISLTFDGGRQSQYANALPLLQQAGFKATFYINPATIETNNYMSAAQLSQLSNGGNEIGARGYDQDDMTAINSNALDYQLHEGRDYLQSAGYQVTDFAPPFGRSDAEVQFYSHQYFSTLRGTDSGINTWQNLDPYNLKVLDISAFTTQQQLTAALASAKDEDGWLILVYQGIGDVGLQQSPSSTQDNISLSTFTQQMNIIKNSGIKVMPVASAYATMK